MTDFKLDHLVIYEVKSSDTLNSIAGTIGMTADELRDFHNANCQKVGLLWFNGLTGIQKVVMPKNYKSEQQIRQEIIDAIPPRNLPVNFYGTTYKVEESFENADGKELTVDYLVDISVEQKPDDDSHHHISSVNCYDFKKEGAKPDNKMSALSLACMKSISPLKFIIPFKGQISTIYNFENLRKSFVEKRPDLEEFFIGDVSTKYMNKFEENVSDEIYFTKQIKSTLLYQVLFPKMGWFHEQKPWREIFYLVKNSFPVHCIFKSSFIHLDEEHIQTDIKGKIEDKVSLQELLTGRRDEQQYDEPMIGNIELQFTTHKTTKKIIRVQANVILLLDDEIYRKQTIDLKQN